MMEVKGRGSRMKEVGCVEVKGKFSRVVAMWRWRRVAREKGGGKERQGSTMGIVEDGVVEGGGAAELRSSDGSMERGAHREQRAGNLLGGGKLRGGEANNFFFFLFFYNIYKF